MDHKVAEFAARLPTRLKVRWRTLRYIQQRLCERYLPGEVLARKKRFHRRRPICCATSIGDGPRLSRGSLASPGTASCASRARSAARRARRRQGRPRQPAVALVNSEAWHRMDPRQSQAELAERIAATERASGSKERPRRRRRRYSMLRSRYQSAVRRRPSLIRTLGSKPSTRRALAIQDLFLVKNSMRRL